MTNDNKKNENQKKRYFGNKSRNTYNKPQTNNKTQASNKAQPANKTQTTNKAQPTSKPQTVSKPQTASKPQTVNKPQTSSRPQTTTKKPDTNSKVKSSDIASISVSNSLSKIGKKPTNTQKPSEMKAIVENKSNRVRNVSKVKRERLKIIPLGGIEEVGKNITVFEYGDEIIVVDCGVAFPEDEMLGVDLVSPDISYLTKNKEKVKAFVITHGHEDHIGSIPYVLKEINVPIYATRLTCGLIKTKLEEHKMVRTTSLKVTTAGQRVKIGNNFEVEFIQSTHSIADSVMLAIHTPVGIIVHTGDFKVDFTPIDGKVMDFARLAELGKQGVLALMSDSTNSEREGFTMSEKTVGKVFDNIFNGCQKRIIVATFASNVHRVQQIINSAFKNGRKVAIAGRSMENVMKVAEDLGYLSVPEGILIDIDAINDYVPQKVVIITTGSQGETMAGLSRMAAGSHRKVQIGNEDLVIISAHPIPGNEKMVSDVVDDLIKIGAEVIYHDLADIHVSGHACSEEQKLILSLIKPKYFIPVHGEYRHLKAHSETAKKVGIPEDNILIMYNGAVVELDTNFCKIVGSVPAGNVLIDGLGVGDVGNIVLRDRQHLSQDGLIVIVMAMDKKTGKILSGPDIISRGFVYVRESEDLMDEIKKVAMKEIESFENKNIKDWSVIKNSLKDSLHDYLFSKTKRNPMLIPIITEV